MFLAGPIVYRLGQRVFNPLSGVRLSVGSQMKILSIETSCDETAISILEVTGASDAPVFRILSNIVRSQIEMHKEFGGVFPTVAKREHVLNLPPILIENLKLAGLYNEKNSVASPELVANLRNLLSHETGLTDQVIKIFETIEKPDIDAIAITNGPGLEPALWVGVNFTKALNLIWDIPVMPVNHMEGHALSILLDSEKTESQSIALDNFKFPALALLISGGHTELVLIKDWLSYEKIGATRDDAVGEAFDKVARLLGLPYPGGPEVSRLAREGVSRDDISLPRPMIKSDDYEFSFSGIKTAVLYLLKNFPILEDQTKKDIAKEFETAVTEVLVSKTIRAIDEFGVRTLIVAGGVAGNTYIRNEFEKTLNGYDIKSYFPTRNLATDNSLMIGIVGALHILTGNEFPDAQSIKADSNLSL